MKIQHLTEREKGIIALVGMALIYGLLPLLPRFLEESLTVFQQIYLRMALGFLLTLVFFHRRVTIKKFLKLSKKELGWVFFRSLLYYSLGVGLYTVAVLHAKISNVIFIEAIPMTALLGFVLLREKITFPKMLLVFISFCGVLLIAVKQIGISFEFGIGELAALASSFFVSLGLITRKWQSTTLNDYETGTLMLFFASFQMVFISLITRESLPIHGWNGTIAFVLLLGGLFNAALSFLLNYSFARVDAVLASNVISLQTLFALIFAYIVFREVPLPRELLGGVVILAGAILLHRYEKRNKVIKDQK